MGIVLAQLKKKKLKKIKQNYGWMLWVVDEFLVVRRWWTWVRLFHLLS